MLLRLRSGVDGEVCYLNSVHSDVDVIADHLGTIDGDAFTFATPGGAPDRKIDTRNRRSATTGALSITTDTVLAAPHMGNIFIAANDVTLDCDGHTITGAGTDESAGNGITIQSRSGVTIKDCHVTNFQVGLWIDDSHSIMVSDSSAIGVGDDGFLIFGTNDATLINNTANNNGEVSTSSTRRRLRARC